MSNSKEVFDALRQHDVMLNQFRRNITGFEKDVLESFTVLRNMIAGLQKRIEALEETEEDILSDDT